MQHCGDNKQQVSKRYCNWHYSCATAQAHSMSQACIRHQYAQQPRPSLPKPECHLLCQGAASLTDCPHLCACDCPLLCSGGGHPPGPATDCIAGSPDLSPCSACTSDILSDNTCQTSIWSSQYTSVCDNNCQIVLNTPQCMTIAGGHHGNAFDLPMLASCDCQRVFTVINMS